MSKNHWETQGRDELGRFTSMSTSDLKKMLTIDLNFFRGSNKIEERGEIPEIPKEAHGFKKDRLATSHHERHAKEMGYKGQKEYQKAAKEFWEKGEGDLYYGHRRGRFILYDAIAERFLTISPDGIIHTFYQMKKKDFDLKERFEQYERVLR